MSIKQRIDTDLKAALLAGDKDRAMVLRGLKSTILNAEIAEGVREQGLDDTRVIQLLNKEVKSRTESAELYDKGGSPERAQQELAEKAIIEDYLPAQISNEELENVINQTISELQATSVQHMGAVIAKVREKVAGQADGSRIAAAVKGRLQ